MQTKRQMEKGCPNQAKLSSGYEMANKKERTHGGKEKEKKKRKEEQQTNKQTNKTKTTFSKERGGKKCQREAGQRLDTRNPCTRYNPFS